MAGGDSDFGAVLGNVQRLCDMPAASLDDVERVLTDGYAWVLQAEDERRRLRDKLQERAATVPATVTPDDLAEIRALAQGIARAESEIEELRAALSVLAAKASRLRVSRGAAVGRT